jgi:hypothetical protein
MIKMTGAGEKLTAEELNRLTQKWWETTVIDATGKYVWDEEIKAVNGMADDFGVFPEWALRVRDAMPKYGFEMCSHRWLDGLDNVICMIGAEDFCPSTAGTCGDVPGRVVNAAEGRAKAVQDWIDGTGTGKDGHDGRVSEWLGEQSPEKIEAATCFVELVRGFLCGTPAATDPGKTAAEWRKRTDQNQILGDMFDGEGFDCLLECGCGFKILDRLDVYIHMIGGDQAQAAERHGICNGQLRFVFRDDPERYEVTRGYLWGLHAYLAGHDEDWLRASKPECAGAALYARHGVQGVEGPTPLRRWLVASLLKSTKIWCQRALELTPDNLVPAYATDLPTICPT